MPTLDLRRHVLVVEGEGVHLITEAQADTTNGWCALVTLPRRAAKFDLDRTFLKGESVVYPHVDGCGLTELRESVNYSGLRDGFYEADSVMRAWVRFRTYFRVRGGKIRVLNGKTEALTQLREAAARPHVAGAPELDLDD